MKNKFIVFDTNALISALLIPFSVTNTDLRKADEQYQLLFSEGTLTELNEVLVRSKFEGKNC